MRSSVFYNIVFKVYQCCRRCQALAASSLARIHRPTAFQETWVLPSSSRFPFSNNTFGIDNVVAGRPSPLCDPRWASPRCMRVVHQKPARDLPCLAPLFGAVRVSVGIFHHVAGAFRGDRIFMLLFQAGPLGMRCPIKTFSATTLPSSSFLCSTIARCSTRWCAIAYLCELEAAVRNVQGGRAGQTTWSWPFSGNSCNKQWIQACAGDLTFHDLELASYPRARQSW